MFLDLWADFKLSILVSNFLNFSKRGIIHIIKNKSKLFAKQVENLVGQNFGHQTSLGAKESGM